MKRGVKPKMVCSLDDSGNIINIYESIREAIKDAGTGINTLKNAIYGNYGNNTGKKINGVRWAHCVSDKKPHAESEGKFAGYIPTYRIDPKESVNVCSMDEKGNIIEKFQTAKDAAAWMNVSVGTIRNALDGGDINTTVGGFRWRYYKDGNIIYAEDAQRRTLPKWRVCAIDRRTGNVVKVYKSAPEAARELGMSVSNINMAISGKMKNITAGGYKWARFNEGHLGPAKKYRKRSLYIVTERNGEEHTFPTMRDTAAFLHVTPSSVSIAIRTNGNCMGCRIRKTSGKNKVPNDCKYCTGKAVRIVDNKSEEVLKEYPSVRALAKDMGNITYEYLIAHIDRAIQNGHQYRYRVEYC